MTETENTLKCILYNTSVVCLIVCISSEIHFRPDTAEISQSVEDDSDLLVEMNYVTSPVAPKAVIG